MPSLGKTSWTLQMTSAHHRRHYLLWQPTSQMVSICTTLSITQLHYRFFKIWQQIEISCAHHKSHKSQLKHILTRASRFIEKGKPVGTRGTFKKCTDKWSEACSFFFRRITIQVEKIWGHSYTKWEHKLCIQNGALCDKMYWMWFKLFWIHHKIKA